MEHSFTDDQIYNLNEYGFNGNQIDRLEALALNLNLDLDYVFNEISQIINGYPPEEPDFDVRISNEILIRLVERELNSYTFEDIQSLLEYGLIDEDFEWLLDNPYALYEDVYHLVGDGMTFDEIKEYYDGLDEDDEPEEGGGKRRRKSRKQRKSKKRKQTKRRTQRKRKKQSNRIRH